MRLDRQDLLSAKLGDSNSMEIGDFVLAVGSPFGLIIGNLRHSRPKDAAI